MWILTDDVSLSWLGKGNENLFIFKRYIWFLYPFYSVENKSKVGIFKDEESGLLTKAQHSNGAKSYLYAIQNNTELDLSLMNETEKETY